VLLALVEYVDGREEDVRVEGVDRVAITFAARPLTLMRVAWCSASDALTSAKRRRKEMRVGMRCMVLEPPKVRSVHAIAQSGLSICSVRYHRFCTLIL
jgi:hypothetical protein